MNNDKSVKQAEQLILIVTIIIFLLLFFLKSAPFHFALEEREEPLLGFTAMEQSKAEDPAAMPLTLDVAGETNLLAAETRVKSAYVFGEKYPRHLRVQVKVVNKGGSPASNIRMEIPLMGNLDSPYQVLVKETFSHAPAAVNELPGGNRLATFAIASLPPGASETITLDYYLQVTPLKVNLASLFGYRQQDVGSVDPLYLLPGHKIESDHPEIINKAREVAAGLKDDLEKAEAFFNFVVSHMRYDLNSFARNTGALSALRGRSGVCEDYAALFVALCRAEGIPARIVNGYADPGGRGDIWNIPAGKSFPLKGYRHTWAEFYLAGIGWVPVDPTMNIYEKNLSYFASLPRPSHLAQNYQDQNLRIRYHGGQLAVYWVEELRG